MTRKIYISGKISGLTEKEYTENFRNAGVFILLNYVPDDIVSPLHLKPFLGIKCWFFYMVKDIYYLRKCTHIAMQKNWIDSKGAVLEYFAAKFIFKLKIIWL